MQSQNKADIVKEKEQEIDKITAKKVYDHIQYTKGIQLQAIRQMDMISDWLRKRT